MAGNTQTSTGDGKKHQAGSLDPNFGLTPEVDSAIESKLNVHMETLKVEINKKLTGLADEIHGDVRKAVKDGVKEFQNDALNQAKKLIEVEINNFRLQVDKTVREQADKVLKEAAASIKFEDGAVNKAVGEAFRKAGMYDVAAKLEGLKEPKEGFWDVVLDTPIRTKHVLIAIGAGGAAWLVYEGVAYLLRNKFPNMPRFFGSSVTE